MKHEQKHRALEIRGRMKETSKEINRKVRERCPRPTIVAFLCRVTKRKRGCQRARPPESSAGITGEIHKPKIKNLSKVHHQR